LSVLYLRFVPKLNFGSKARSPTYTSGAPIAQATPTFDKKVVLRKRASLFRRNNIKFLRVSWSNLQIIHDTTEETNERETLELGDLVGRYDQLPLSLFSLPDQLAKKSNPLQILAKSPEEFSLV